MSSIIGSFVPLLPIVGKRVCVVDLKGGKKKKEGLSR